MVCPICVTTAIVANAPTIAAVVGGAAAAKAAKSAYDKRPPTGSAQQEAALKLNINKPKVHKLEISTPKDFNH